jgi:hypothetical protein
MSLKPLPFHHSNAGQGYPNPQQRSHDLEGEQPKRIPQHPTHMSKESAFINTVAILAHRRVLPGDAQNNLRAITFSAWATTIFTADTFKSSPSLNSVARFACVP